MLIEKIDRDPKRTVSHSVRRSVLDRLENYRDLYKETYGEEIDRSELIERLVIFALDRDKTFRSYERQLAVQAKKAGPHGAGQSVRSALSSSAAAAVLEG